MNECVKSSNKKGKRERREQGRVVHLGVSLCVSECGNSGGILQKEVK